MSLYSKDVQSFGLSSVKNEYSTKDCMTYSSPNDDLKRGGAGGGAGAMSLGSQTFGRPKMKPREQDESKEVVFGGGKITKNLMKEMQRDGVGKQRKWRGQVTNKEHVFGMRTDLSETSKNLIYPVDVDGNGKIEEEEKVRKMYEKSHRRFEPGQQMSYGCDWEKTSVKNKNFRFGVKVTSNYSVKDVIAVSVDDTKVGKEKIVSKCWSDFKKMRSAKLGKSRKGQISKDIVFGKVGGKDEWGAKECIVGDYKYEDIVPDQGFGKSASPHGKGFKKDASLLKKLEGKVFGVKKIKPSEENISQSSLKPSIYSKLGITKVDFDTLKTKVQLQSIMFKSRAVANQDEFDRIFNKALIKFEEDIKFVRSRDEEPDQNKVMTVHQFKTVLFDDIEENTM